MKTLLTLIILLTAVLNAVSQQHYPIFTQNYSNPFLVNPSLINLERRAEINTTYRQQWVGITNSPTTLQFDIQYPINPKVSLGLNFYNDKTILLSSTGALATFGYKVRLSSYHIVGFGLSGGFISNQIDLDNVPDIDLIDPVLLGSSNNFGFDGQFGMHYRYKRFILGFSLLKLTDNRPFSDEVFEREKFSPFEDKAAMVSYHLNLTEDISLQPFLLYRTTFTGYEYMEGSLLFDYKNIITIGGGYRTDFGPNAVIRLRFKNLSAGYAYDFPNTKFGGSTGGTHEAQLKFRFGQPTSPIELAVKPDSTITKSEHVVAQEVKTAPQQTQETSVEEEKKPVENTVVQTPTEQPVVKKEVPEVRSSEIKEEDLAGADYHLVVGVFAKRSFAERYVQQLKRENVEAVVKTKSDTQFFYVIVPHYTTRAITLEKVLDIRNNTQFKDAWFERFD